MPTETRRTFLNEIPADLKKGYEEHMDATPRWMNGAVRESRVLESDLDHTYGLLQIIDYIRKEFPVLCSEINMDKTEETAYVHDAGEIGVGDLALSNPNYNQIQAHWKHLEKAVFRKLTRDHISDPILRQKARYAYDRYVNYEKYKEHDMEDYKVGLLVHLIDKVQAARFGERYVFRAGIDPMIDPHLNGRTSLGKILEFTGPLLDTLSENAREELIEFVGREVKRFTQNGLRELTSEGLERLTEIVEKVA
jgi:5'-deoxynucleotidase YfbR-like HD superfamily hydrolase